jgi:hypothetical protein
VSSDGSRCPANREGTFGKKGTFEDALLSRRSPLFMEGALKLVLVSLRAPSLSRHPSKRLGRVGFSSMLVDLN